MLTAVEMHNIASCTVEGLLPLSILIYINLTTSPNICTALAVSLLGKCCLVFSVAKNPVREPPL